MTPAKDFPAKALFDRLHSRSTGYEDWFLFRFADHVDFMTRFGQQAPFPVVRRKIGWSVEGRPLETYRFGSGKRRVLIWARQHGDEPECTGALCVTLQEFLSNREDPLVKSILEELDILLFPVVNPDGMEHCTRQNGMGIDLNRDAGHLAMPEGRALATLKDEFEPDFSFNLHDMCPRKAREGKDAGLISVAYQAGPFDESNSDNDVRLRAKTIVARMAEVAAEITSQDSICVYKAFYMHRAFGDSMMRWGVPCVLIESGSWPAEKGGEEYLVRLHALSLLAGLYFVAQGNDEPFDGPAYDKIPFDVATHEFDLLYRGTRVVDGQTGTLFRADVGIQTELQDYRTDRNRQYDSIIDKIGDLSEENAADQRDLNDGLLIPGGVFPAASLTANKDFPTEEAIRPHLEKGRTLLAAGFGPFESSEDRQAFIEKAYLAPPPIHIAAYERVAGLEAIRTRHGMTEFAGFVLPARRAALGELAAFWGDLGGRPTDVCRDEEVQTMCTATIWYTAARSPRESRLLIALDETPCAEASPLTEAELAAFAREFLVSCGQVVIFPASELEKGDCVTLAQAHWRLALALGLRRHGTLRPSASADLVLLENENTSSPQQVVLNGRVVIDNTGGHAESPRGLWLFAN